MNKKVGRCENNTSTYFIQEVYMKETWKNLLKVKSIVTILLTVTFVVMLILGVTIPQEFIMIYTTVISFYFGTQAQKIADGKDQSGQA